MRVIWYNGYHHHLDTAVFIIIQNVPRGQIPLRGIFFCCGCCCCYQHCFQSLTKCPTKRIPRKKCFGNVPHNASHLRGNFKNSHFCPGGNFRGAKLSKSNISLQYNIQHLQRFFLLHRKPSMACHYKYKQILLPNTTFPFDLPPGSNQLWNIFAGRVNDQKFHY